MQAVMDYLRLGLGGLFLDPRAYQQQRESPDRLTRGFILVTLIGVLVGLAALIGQTIEALASPDADDVAQTIYDGLIAMPWYQNVVGVQPSFEQDFAQLFDQTMSLIQMIDGGGVAGGLVGVVLTPIMYLLGWLLFGVVAHGVARMLGGRGTLNQTLGCTALAAGPYLLNLVRVVPFAQSAGVALLSLLASYIAIREAHELRSSQAFWATMLGPLLLVGLLFVMFCIFFSAIVSFVSSLGGGVQ